MSLTEVCQTMIQYHVSLNRRVWQSVLALSDEQFLATADYAHGSVRNQIVHLAGVDGRWLRGLQGQPDARSFNPPPEQFATRETVFALWDPIERELLAFVQSQDEAALQRKPPGLAEPAWQVILHLANHGTDHRAQLLRSLHDLGAPSFAQDLILYLWDAPLLAAWQAEERQPFRGWDFSYLKNRMWEDAAPWSYAGRAAELLRQSASAIDLGTGGGERLLELRSAWPPRMAATEEYPPNFTLSSEHLVPLGVAVKAVRLTRSDPLPYADGEFELVLNRHSAFNSREVARILARGGTFFTQQVDGHWAEDLQAVFGVRPQWPDATLENSLAWLRAAGMEIVDAREHVGRLSFQDVSAVVYYLRAVPWLVPGFSAESHFAGLKELQRRHDGGETLAFLAKTFLIEARKPG